MKSVISLTSFIYFSLECTFLQLSNRRVNTCVALRLTANFIHIFMDPACTSDTEEDDSGDLYCMHLPWCSPELTDFAHKLDNATVERLCKAKGAWHIQKAKLLELCRRNPVNTSQVLTVPIGFSRNCYSPTFLQSRSKVAQEVLNYQDEPLEFPLIWLSCWRCQRIDSIIIWTTSLVGSLVWSKAKLYRHTCWSETFLDINM